MRQTALHVAIIVAIAGLVMFTNLGGPLLWDRDEPRNAGCVVEMLARGDWVTPVFNAELRTHKPVLLYWLMMTAYSVFGVSEFSARFWSAALAVGTAICTYSIGRRLFDPRVGVWAGVIVATTLMFDVAGRAATPDSALIFFSTLAITFYVHGAFRGSERCARAGDATRPFFPSWSRATAMYAVMGIAMLAKGPVGLVLPTAVIGMFLLIMRLPAVTDGTEDQRWTARASQALRVFGPLHFLRTCWAMRPLTALAASLAIALPWYVWVGLRTDGAFLQEFFLEHNLGRATNTMEGHSGSLFLFYPVAILVGFFPWSVFAGPVLLDAIRNGRGSEKWRSGYLFAACWIGVYVVLFSFASTKLPSYVTPCYPALALVTGCFVSRWTSDSLQISRHWLRASLGTSILVGLVVLIALPIAAHMFLPGEEWLGLLGVVPLCGGGIALFLHEKQRRQQAALTFAAAASLFVILLLGGVADRVSRHQRNEVLLDAINAHGTNPRVASFGPLEPTWVFYGRRSIDQLSRTDLGLARAWIEKDGKWMPKTRLTANRFANEDNDVFIITLASLADSLLEKLPSDFHVVAEAPYFLRDRQLVVVGSIAPSKTARRQSSESPNDR
jgi:4-amino-4-deoxy-L-arabinose transferase-like glycosyltransferase